LFGRAFDQDRIGIVDVRDAPRGDIRQCRKRAVVAVDRHVPHAAAGFGSAVAIISSSRKSVPSKKRRRRVQSSAIAASRWLRRNEADARTSGRQLDPDIRTRLDRGLRVLPSR
jgi:hypothetical protein